jgi:hypothetical protein
MFKDLEIESKTKQKIYQTYVVNSAYIYSMSLLSWIIDNIWHSITNALIFMEYRQNTLDRYIWS